MTAFNFGQKALSSILPVSSRPIVRTTLKSQDKQSKAVVGFLTEKNILNDVKAHMADEKKNSNDKKSESDKKGSNDKKSESDKKE